MQFMAFFNLQAGVTQNCQKFMVNFSIYFVIFLFWRMKDKSPSSCEFYQFTKWCFPSLKEEEETFSKAKEKMSPGQAMSGNDTPKSSQNLLVCGCSVIDTSYLMLELHIIWMLTIRTISENDGERLKQNHPKEFILCTKKKLMKQLHSVSEW